jgi:hypothetical protein
VSLQNLQHQEAILAVPHRLVLSNEKAKKDPHLSRVFTENPMTFGD